MSLRAALRVACLLAIVAVALSSQAADLSSPNAPPPQPARVILQDGRLYWLQAMSVPETRTRLAEVNGKRQEEAYTVMVPQTRIQSAANGSYRVITVGGKALSDEEAAEALAKEKEVLLSVSGKRIDYLYSSLYPRGTLVVYIRPELALQPPAATGDGPQPRFSDATPSKGLPPSIGFLHQSDGEVVLTAHRWHIVSEYKLVHVEVNGPDGKPMTVAKNVRQMHWIPESVDIKLDARTVSTVDRTGRQTHGALDGLSEQPIPVFVQDTKGDFDPGHFRLCSPNTVVVLGDFPWERLEVDYKAPAAPKVCFASVKEQQLVLGRVVQEATTVTVVVTALENGEEVTKNVQETKLVSKFVWQSIPLGNVEAKDAAGMKLDTAVLAKQLASVTPVLVAEGDQAVDPMYLAALKPEAIVLTLPPMHRPLDGPRAPQRPVPSPAGAPQASTPSGETADHSFVFAQAAALTPAENAPTKSPAQSPPPRFVQVLSHADKLFLRDPLTQYMRPPALPPVAGEKPEAAPLSITHWHSRFLDANAFRVFRTHGQPMDSATFSASAKRPVIALLSDHGRRIDPKWLSIFKPDTMLVYVRPSYGGHLLATPKPMGAEYATPRPAPAPPASALPPL